MKRLLLLLLMFTTAYTQNDLPPIGTEISMSMLATNTPLRIRTTFITVDFRGELKQRVESNPTDPSNSRLLRVIGFKMSGELPDDGGILTIEQNNIDVDAQSLLRLTQRSPPTYEAIFVLSFTMTFDQPDSEAMVLTTKNPMKLIGQLTQFPPKGRLYRLQDPVHLILPENPDSAIATIEKFPVKIGGL